MRPRRFVKVLLRAGKTELDRARSRSARSDLAVFHEFHAPPYGGGNQFLLALLAEWRRRGLDVEVNEVSGHTPSCLYNSFNFDFRRLRRFAGDGVRLVHRVDGPIAAYRGFDDGTDARIVEINALADATILQSRYSLAKHEALGLELRNPVVIPNTVDPAIFRPPSSFEPIGDRPLRVVTSSWSENPRKGADVLRWLDENLDVDAVHVTFAGQTRERFERIRVVPPMPSRELADVLRAHDVYLAPSIDDPCSNALLEGLACGLPAAYRRSGGHPELVGDAGIAFDTPEEVPAVLAQLREELHERRAAIHVTPLATVADRYLEALRP
jgi:glycosyltransferase involved in cell wall biosynthesis